MLSKYSIQSKQHANEDLTMESTNTQKYCYYTYNNNSCTNETHSQHSMDKVPSVPLTKPLVSLLPQLPQSSTAAKGCVYQESFLYNF